MDRLFKTKRDKSIFLTGLNVGLAIGFVAATFVVHLMLYFNDRITLREDVISQRWERAAERSNTLVSQSVLPPGFIVLDACQAVAADRSQRQVSYQ